GGRRIMFVGADGAIRQPKVARRDRTEVDLFGIQLSLMWKDIVTQLYADTSQRHRLDMINTILNQRPPDMWELERRIRRFKRSVGSRGKASFVSKYNIGLREFAVIVHFEDKMILPDTFHQLGRNLTMQLLPEGGAVECTAFLFVQKSKSATFSMASFYRYVTPSELGIRSR
ncbi:hypothetical protein, partial [Asticcacaulis benevestitus]|uniref:hypothetical protein n=1 Tax=Asticcacaulis benevestitus TaxID=347481 RepID=UPI0005597A21